MAIVVQNLPLVLAGPILRRVSKERVAIWVALKQQSQVTATVLNASTGATVKASTATATHQVGSNLHLAVIDVDFAAGQLQEDTRYAYNLSFSGGGDLKSAGILKAGAAPPTTMLSYAALDGTPAAGLPTFVTPRSDLNKVRIAQGSCRKAHGESLDAMTILDADIESSFTDTTVIRPQQLFLTGDQIYADDVADSLLLIIRDAAAALVGDVLTSGGAANDGSRLGPGARTAFARDVAGLTSDPTGKTTVAKSHLVSFGEFAAMYLLSWSEALWPSPFKLSAYNDIYPDKATTIDFGESGEVDTTEFTEFKRENTALTSFFLSLPKARRALANVAVYMLLDDHEVTDDFFIDYRWVEKMLNSTNKVGLGIVRNGLLGYALFQGWGNEPDNASGQPDNSQFAPLLTAVSAWATANFQPSDFGASDPNLQQITALLGLPTGLPAPGAGPGEFLRASSPSPLDFSCRYFFAGAYEVLALDTRTRRQYPDPQTGKLGKLTPAGLISDASLANQIPATVPAWTNPDGGVTFVITPGPGADLSAIENAQLGAKTEEAVFDKDVELLHFDAEAFDSLHAVLAARDPGRTRVVYLSGDVHFAFAYRSQYWSKFKNPLKDATLASPFNKAVFAQFLSSALKNQGLPDFFSSMALQYSGFRLHKRDITRFGWRGGGAQSLRVGTAAAITVDDLQGNVQTQQAAWDVTVGRNGTAVTELADEASKFLSVTPDATRGVDWRMHRVLFGNGPKGAQTNPVSNVIDVLVAIVEVLFNWLFGYLRVCKGGKEVVAVNNLGFLTISWGSGDDKTATQQLRWYDKNRDGLYEAQNGDPTGTPYLQFLSTTSQQIPLALEDPPALGEIDFPSGL